MSEAFNDQSPPPVDPTAGEEANEVAAQARRDLEAELSSGNATLEDVFEQSDTERDSVGDAGAPHRPIGHMHIGAALLALPNIGETHTDQILNSAGLTRDRHIDSLGDDERTDLLDLVEAYDS